MLSYSPSTGGFYEDGIHGEAIPSDAIAITAQQRRQLLAGVSEGKQIAIEDGVPVAMVPPPPSIEDLAARQRAAITEALANALAAGMPYTMPDSTEDTVQMLAEDRQNLLGLAIEARDLKAAGETGAVQEFRAASNTRYPMTPDETIALTDAALGHYKVLLQRSWDRKDTIAAALEAQDREGIEAVVW